MEQAWTVHKLAEGGEVQMGALPQEMRPDDTDDFESWWTLHPLEHHEIMMHGKSVAIPRWQQAYGRDYRFSGQVSPAKPLTPEMGTFLAWARNAIHPDLNGVLMNWYDGSKGHYIGAHRDSTMGLVKGSPIVTISLGERRAFRMRPYKKKGFEDFNVGHGEVLVIPWKTNLVYTHEVPRARRYTHRRVSITLRAFEV